MWASGAYGYLSDYLCWYLVLGSLIVHTWCFFRISRAWSRRRARLIIGNFFVCLSLLIFTGLVAETYLRFVSDDTDAFGASLTCKRWHKAYARLNSQFFRDPEWTEQKPPGVERIAFLGDSFVYGWGVKNEEDRFSNLIQRRFDERRPGSVQVMNFGWSAWDTPQELHALTSVLPDYHVDEVVLCYLPNDIVPWIPALAHANPNETYTTHYFNTDSSYLINFLYYRIVARRLAYATNYWDRLAGGYADPQIWSAHSAELQGMIDLCKERGTRLRVAVLPLLMTAGDYSDARAIHAKVTEFFTSRGVSTVDLLPVIEGRDTTTLVVSDHDPHPNELANRLFAEAIWKAFYADPHK